MCRGTVSEAAVCGVGTSQAVAGVGALDGGTTAPATAVEMSCRAGLAVVRAALRAGPEHFREAGTTAAGAGRPVIKPLTFEETPRGDARRFAGPATGGEF